MLTPSSACRFLDEADVLDKAPNELLVALIRGRDLVIKDKNMFSKGGTSDPQVVFAVPGTDPKVTTRKSTYKNNTLAPLWNETFAIPLTPGEVTAPTLACLCQDYDDLSSPDSMGVVDVPLSRLGHRRSRGWYPLGVDPKRPKDAVSGALELVLLWRHNADLAFEPFLDAADNPEREPNELLVAVARGRDLAIRDKNMFSKGGSSDPRVKVEIVGNAETLNSTTTKKKTLNPVWNETFAVLCTPNEAPVLRAKCEDYDLLSAADHMGEVDVDVSRFIDRQIHRTHSTHFANHRPAVAQAVKSCRITAPASRREGDEPA